MTEPRAFLDIAKALLSDSTPAYCRTAIGRAYYAAFNVGAQLLRGLECRISQGPEAHKDVRELLDLSDIYELTIAATNLGDLREQRNEADYVLDNAGVETLDTANTVISQAEETITILEEFKSKFEKARSSYQAAINCMKLESAKREQDRQMRRRVNH